MWRHCGCGYDFGPGERSEEARLHKPSWEPEKDWLTGEARARFARFYRYLNISILVAFLLTHFIYPMDWLTKAAAFVLCTFLWCPWWVSKSKT